jgi:hypothetical protein
MKSLLSKTKQILIQSVKQSAMLSHQFARSLKPYHYPRATHENLQQEVKKTIPILEKCLLANIAYFWLTRGIDDCLTL